MSEQAMTDSELQAIAQRAETATEGPWENCRGFVRSPVHGSEMAAPGFTVTTSCLWVAECRDGEAFYNADANADFIAHARTDIPALLAEITRLQAQVASWESQARNAFDSLLLLGEERDRLRAQVAECERLRTDPAAVRVNLLRGTIAKPDDLIFMHDSDGPYARLRAQVEAMRGAALALLKKCEDADPLQAIFPFEMEQVRRAASQANGGEG